MHISHKRFNNVSSFDHQHQPQLSRSQRRFQTMPTAGIVSSGPEAQDELFGRREFDAVPENLTRATLRLQFPPTYVIVGVYRLFSDKSLYIPAWDKCKHATQRGAIVGVIWVRFTCFCYCVIVMFLGSIIKNCTLCYNSLLYDRHITLLPKLICFFIDRLDIQSSKEVH